MAGMLSWAEVAARNNARWCSVVCGTHGIEGRFDDAAWTSSTRTPSYYPDAVTLVDDLDVGSLLGRVDLVSPGCSVKDSFAALDLSAYGFEVGFDAHWIARAEPPPDPDATDLQWRRVDSAGLFADWAAAWSGDAGPQDVLRPELMRHEDVAVLAGFAGEHLVAGAVLNRSGAVVGVSNVFARDEAGDDPWPGCLILAAELFPGAPLVGYESGDELAAALLHGFRVVGPLRVWFHAR